MTIRIATIADLEGIAAIQGVSPEASHWDPASYLAYDCLVAMVASRVAGFLVARQTGPGEREILNLAVGPEQRRQGIARQLLQEELASAKGAWFLEVRESNAPALGLYTAAGFQIAGRRRDYYNNPTETGVVMRFFS